MKFALGIDLGTTNSVVSVYRRGKVESIMIEGRRTFPSVVSFKDKNTMLVGHPAKKMLILDPEHTVGSVKRFMGNRKQIYKIYGKEYSPVEISSFILKKLVEEAEKALGEKVKDVIISVPAYFTDAQKEDTKKAGELAGLNVMRLFPEPSAAAVAYGFDKGKDQTLLVYDLGGGTFDVSILKVEGNKFDVIAVDGDSHLGGDDFDAVIVEYLLDIFEEKTGKSLKGDNSKYGTIAKQKLKEAAEKAKVELSQAKSTVITVPEVMGETIDETLTLKQYNKLIKPFMDRTITKIQSALKEADLQPTDIDRVILVGGSTRNTAVKEIVTNEIKEPFTSEYVDEIVSHGAALFAASLSVPEEDKAKDLPKKIDVKEKTGHSLGVELLDQNKRLVFAPIIEKNSTYPIDQGILAFTVSPFQEHVLLEVFRGESKNCKDNVKLGQLRLKISDLSKDPVPISAIFQLDENGILHFSCVELPINIGESRIIEVVKEAVDNNGIINIEKIQRLMEKKLVKFEKTKITATD